MPSRIKKKKWFQKSLWVLSYTCQNTSGLPRVMHPEGHGTQIRNSLSSPITSSYPTASPTPLIQAAWKTFHITRRLVSRPSSFSLPFHLPIFLTPSASSFWASLYREESETKSRQSLDGRERQLWLYRLTHLSPQNIKGFPLFIVSFPSLCVSSIFFYNNFIVRTLDQYCTTKELIPNANLYSMGKRPRTV